MRRSMPVIRGRRRASCRRGGCRVRRSPRSARSPSASIWWRAFSSIRSCAGCGRSRSSASWSIPISSVSLGSATSGSARWTVSRLSARGSRSPAGCRGRRGLWVAGFDLFYSLFDRDVDVEQGLHSFAVRFGVAGAFWGARLFHLATVALLAAVGLGLNLGWLYWLGVAAVALLLTYEHSLVRPGDLRKLDAAFFTVNGVISVVFFAFVLAEAAV